MRMSTQGLRPQQLVSVLGDRARVIEALQAAFRCSHRTSFLESSAPRVAQLLKSDVTWLSEEPAAGPNAATITAFVEQWVIDVASMTDGMVAGVRETLGDDGLMDFIHSLLVIEQRVRLDLAWQRLGLSPELEVSDVDETLDLDQWGSQHPLAGDPHRSDPHRSGPDVPPCPGRIAPGRHGNKQLTAALSEWQAAVVCLDEIDPVTTELVRLRCANYHDCHT